MHLIGFNEKKMHIHSDAAYFPRKMIHTHKGVHTMNMMKAVFFYFDRFLINGQNEIECKNKSFTKLQ